MERDQIRLECIKLAANRTTNHTEAMARAKDFFEFVTEHDGTQKEVVVSKDTKMAGNAKPRT